MKLYTTSGFVQYYSSIQDCMAQQNSRGRVYSIVFTEDGPALFHKGQRRVCGVFVASSRGPRL